MTTREFGKVTSNQLYLYALVLYILLNYTILGVQWNYPFSILKNAAQIILTYFIPFLLCLLPGRSQHTHYHCPYHGVVGLRAPPAIRFSIL